MNLTLLQFHSYLLNSNQAYFYLKNFMINSSVCSSLFVSVEAIDKIGNNFVANHIQD